MKTVGAEWIQIEYNPPDERVMCLCKDGKIRFGIPVCGDVYDGIRYLTTHEREILQGVPIGYTSILTPNESAGVLGDGWTIDIVKEFFKGIH